MFCNVKQLEFLVRCNKSREKPVDVTEDVAWFYKFGEYLPDQIRTPMLRLLLEAKANMSLGRTLSLWHYEVSICQCVV